MFEHVKTIGSYYLQIACRVDFKDLAPGLSDEAYYFCDAYSSFNIQFITKQ